MSTPNSGTTQAPLLLHAFSTFAVGGPQMRFAAIANHFGRRWRHAVVAMDGNLACRERLDPGLDLSFPEIGFQKGDLLGTLRTMRSTLHRLRPAMLLTSNWGTIEWAMANRVAVVPHVHLEDGFGPNEQVTQIPRRVRTRRLFLAGRTVVVPSRTLQRIATEIWRLNPGRVRYVPNGIDLARFGAQGRVPGVPVVGTVAALRPEKNLGRLLRAFAAAAGGSTARLVIVGDGPERGPLGVLAGELGIAAQVDWAGHRPDPAPILRQMDVFVLSSDTEQMPISLLEAMASGLAVASTNVGDVAVMLPDEQRPFVTAPDDAALAGAIRTLLADPATRTRLGGANRARAEAQFDQRTMFDSWAGLLPG